MNKKQLSERDICTKYITPALERAGWDISTQIREEFSHLLKPDTGRAAVVLPDGFLFGEGTKTNLKRELLEDFNLHTIVRLPKGVFSPYTSINTNILFFDKGGATEDVWFFEHPYPPGYKSYSRSKPLTIQEFDREKNWWQM